jgi:probable HAF family extracellular repeat protein
LSPRAFLGNTLIEPAEEPDMSRRKAFHFTAAKAISSSSVLFLLVLLGGLQVISADPIYSVQIVGALSGNASATAINGSGNAVGFITTAAGDQTPAFFNGTTNLLPGVGQANGINSSGIVIGTTTVNGKPTVTEWSAGQAINLGVNGYGTGINDSGQVVGGYINANGNMNAFALRDGTLVNLGTLNGGNWSSANATNAIGQIVGTSMDGNGISTAFFSNGNGMTSLCLTCPSSSYGNALNSNGTAVGSFVNSGGYLHAAEFSDGNAIDLGTLGGFQSVAYGVDEAGDVVGYSYLSDNATTHAFIYSNNVLVDLNSMLPIASGWTITAAYGINATGRIVGTGTQNGQSYAVTLNPIVNTAANAQFTSNFEQMVVPEPAPLFLTGSALALLGTGIWRRRQSTINRER